MITITLNLLSVVRFAAIAMWAFIAFVLGGAMIFLGSKEDTYTGLGLIAICLLSIAALYFAGHP